jgi:hypothetical protein
LSFAALPARQKQVTTTVGGDATMLRQLNRLTLPTAISIASFDATFFVIADLWGMTEQEMLLGLIAGGAGGLSVLVAVLWQSTRNVAIHASN